MKKSILSPKPNFDPKQIDFVPKNRFCGHKTRFWAKKSIQSHSIPPGPKIDPEHNNRFWNLGIEWLITKLLWRKLKSWYDDRGSAKKYISCTYTMIKLYYYVIWTTKFIFSSLNFFSGKTFTSHSCIICIKSIEPKIKCCVRAQVVLVWVFFVTHKDNN